MRPTRFDQAPCPIARCADLVGDPWIPLILRECTYGITRFDDFQRRLSIGRNVLAARLDRMVEQGLLVKEPYQERPPRHAYRLTPKGRGATALLAAMVRFGDDWIFEPGHSPIVLRDRRTGRAIRPQVVDELTGEPIDFEHVVPSPGPGFPGDREAQRAWFAPTDAVRDP